MSKTIINFFLDALLAVSFVAVCWAAMILRFVFPNPMLASGWGLWGWDYAAWSWFEFVCLAVFAIMVLVHVMLHWSWVCGVIARQLSLRLNRKIVIDDSQQTLLGVAVLIVVLHVAGLMFLAAVLMVEEPPPSPQSQSLSQAINSER